MTHAAPDADTTASKQVVRRLYDDCLNAGRLDAVPELVSDAYVGPRGERGPAGFTSALAALRTGFPDIRFTIDDLLADGDRVVVRWHWQATHTGEFNGLAPTGKVLTNTGIAIYRLADHKVVQSFTETDRLGALQQLGLVPASLGRPPGPPPQR